MLTPEDQETIIRMVGPVVAAKLPDGFMKEYMLRAKMMACCGSERLGLAGILCLLRQFKLEPVAAPVQTGITKTTESGSKITYDKRPGVLVGDISPGMVGIRLDGEAAVREVPRAQVMIAKPIIDGISDDKFKKDVIPEGANTPPKMNPTEEKWADVKANTDILVTLGGKEYSAKYLGVVGNETIEIKLQNKKQVVPAADCKLPELNHA